MLRDIVISGVGWWLFYLFTMAVFVLVVELGYRLGRWRRLTVDAEHRAQTGTVLVALLALLGFLLAVSFNTAAGRFADRKALVLEEAKAVGTTFLRADLLPEQQGSEARRLLREYVVLRIDAVATGDLGPLEDAGVRSEAYHRRLWALATEAAEAQPRSIPVGLFVASLNELIDLHEERVTVGLHFHLPPSLLLTLYLVAILAMGTLGIHFGLSGTRSVTATVALVVGFAAVLLLIVDLDQPKQRLFSVGQEPLVDTLQSMDRSLTGAIP